MAYMIKVVECKCGYRSRSSEFETGTTVPCPGRGEDECGKELSVKILSCRFPTMFTEGAIVTLQIPYESLKQRDPKDYPIRKYHGKKVVVLEDGPDNEGLVHVRFPFTSLHVLHGILTG